MRSLVAGTLGDDPGRLWRARTEPLVVPLNVAETLEGLDLHPGLLTVDEALEACDDRHHGDDPQSTVAEEWAAIEVRYQREFAAYAERFAQPCRPQPPRPPGWPCLCSCVPTPIRGAGGGHPTQQPTPPPATTIRSSSTSGGPRTRTVPLPNVDIAMPTTPTASTTNPGSLGVQQS